MPVLPKSKARISDIWGEMNRRYGEMHIAAVEHAIATHGYYFAHDKAQEKHLPLEVRMSAADALIRERDAFLHPLSSPDDVAQAVKSARESGYSLRMVDEIVSTYRDAELYIQRTSGKAVVPKPAAMGEQQEGSLVTT